ncbi:MAG: YraN family protein [Acidobacteria bacterium]|nr:YraN family protein [Acidobacteriota bacterium]
MQSFPAMAADRRQTLGKTGEELACGELVRRGYAILERRYRTRYGEIDIIARADDTLVFVEVKTRAGDRYGGSLAAVTPRKQQQIIRVALDFLVRERIWDRPCRFDVVTVDFKKEEPCIEVYPHAFTA